MSQGNRLGAVGLVAGLAISCGCNINSSQPQEGPFDGKLKAAARDYVMWDRVDDQSRLAPTDCRPPMPSMVRESQSDDAKTHGRKLYFLFAKDRKAYLEHGKTAAIGTVVVKQSWTAKEVPDDGRPLLEKAKPSGGQGQPSNLAVSCVRKDGKQYATDQQADLFIMLKLDPTTPETDHGWVYGTVTPDGAKVTSAGRVDSCMRCHTKAENDRLFGLAEMPKDR